MNSRSSAELLLFTDAASFSDASAADTTGFALSGSAGQSLIADYTVPHGLSYFTVTPSANLSLTGPVLTAGSPNDTENFTLTAEVTPFVGNAQVLSGLGVNVAPAGAIVNLSTGVSAAGYHFLDQFYDPTANQSSGVSFQFSVSIKGNYQPVGTTSGTHQLVSINPSWTIDRNFVYDGSTYTVFAAHKNSYNPSVDRIGLEFQIFGASTSSSGDGPLPPWSLALLAVALIGVASLRRARPAPPRGRR